MTTPETRRALRDASIREMQRALEEDRNSVGDHAIDCAITCGSIDGDGTLTVAMTFSQDIPGWEEYDMAGLTRERLAPSAMVLRIRTSSRAGLFWRDPETGRLEPHELTPEQQRTLDDYATQAGFHLTGLASGAFLTVYDEGHTQEAILGRVRRDTRLRVLGISLARAQEMITGMVEDMELERMVRPGDRAFRLQLEELGELQGNIETTLDAVRRITRANQRKIDGGEPEGT